MIYLTEVHIVLGSALLKENSECLCANISAGGVGAKVRIMDRMQFTDSLSVFSEKGKNEGESLLYVTDNPGYATDLLDLNLPVLLCVDALADFEGCDGIPYLCQDLKELELDYLEGIYRRFKRIPWDICSTERCNMRETTVEDVDAFYEIYKDPSITQYMEDLFENPEDERQYARDYIKNIYEMYGFGVWTVLLRETGEVIGRAGLSYREGYEEPELGFVIGVKWQRQGIAYEICKAILQYGKDNLGFNRVQTFVKEENKASVKLCEKLGFSRGGFETVQGEEYLRLDINL